MDPISTAVASGMRARLDLLDMLANNMANASTAGYKVDREFYSLYRDAEAEDGVLSPVIEKPWTDYSQGALQVTGPVTRSGAEREGLLRREPSEWDFRRRAMARFKWPHRAMS